MVENRFEVSTEGMRELHAGRNPAQLVRELIQNSWDEYPDATECRVTVKAMPNQGHLTRLVVEDDGPGFRRIEDAYTLLGPTEKRMDPGKRGRYNLGEKELISVAVEAKVETVGRTVEFPAGGGKKVRNSRRRRGTRISAVMPWGAEQRETLVEDLRVFRPTDCALHLNGAEVPRRIALSSVRVELPTVIQDGPGQPLRRSSRVTDMDILTPVGDTAYLYELGIPVQRISLDFDVDVGQKIPLNPNRDSVSPGYLKAVSAVVLNTMHEHLTTEQASKVWVRSGLEDRRIEKETVKAVVEKRYGPRVVIASSNRDANLRAMEAGYEVLPSRSLSPDERNNIRNLGGVETAGAIFPEALLAAMTARIEEVEPDKPMREFAEWIRELGRVAGLHVDVKFFQSDSDAVADCGSAGSGRTLLFNVNRLPSGFYEGRGEKQVLAAVHQLAHVASGAGSGHGPAWGETACEVGARIALHLSRQEGQVPELAVAG